MARSSIEIPSLEPVFHLLDDINKASFLAVSIRSGGVEDGKMDMVDASA